jgi:hypothetical protein
MCLFTFIIGGLLGYLVGTAIDPETIPNIIKTLKDVKKQQ